MVGVVTAKAAQGHRVRARKITSHQHPGNAERVVGIVASQAIVLACELWPLLLFLRKTIEDDSLLRGLCGHLNKSTPHPTYDS